MLESNATTADASTRQIQAARQLLFLVAGQMTGLVEQIKIAAYQDPESIHGALAMAKLIAALADEGAAACGQARIEDHEGWLYSPAAREALAGLRGAQ